jgi:hypothetical protein
MLNFTANDEINVEGLACKHAASFPYDDPPACRALAAQITKVVEFTLALRERRLSEGDESGTR